MTYKMTYKSATAIGVFLVFIAGYFLFSMKREVENLDFELTSIRNQVNNEKDSINLLKAEFAALSSPARIKKLASAYLNLSSVTPDKMVIDPIKVELPAQNIAETDIKEQAMKMAEAKPSVAVGGGRSVKWRYKHMGSRYASIKTVSLRQ